MQWVVISWYGKDWRSHSTSVKRSNLYEEKEEIILDEIAFNDRPNTDDDLEIINEIERTLDLSNSRFLQDGGIVRN